MKSKEQKQREATERQKQRAERSPHEQLRELDKRAPRGARKERSRIALQALRPLGRTASGKSSEQIIRFAPDSVVDWSRS